MEHICPNFNESRDVVEKIKKELDSEEEIYDLAYLFKLLADPNRAKLLLSLSISECCVCHLAEILGVSIGAVSHSLKLLRLGRLVKSRKVGKVVYYSLTDDHIKTIIDAGFVHIKE